MFHLKNFMDPTSDGINPIQDGVGYFLRNNLEIIDQVKGYTKAHRYELDRSYYTNPEYYLYYVLEQLNYDISELNTSDIEELISWIDSYLNG